MSLNKSSIVGGGAGSHKGGVLKPTLHDYTAITPHAVTKIPIILGPHHHSTFSSSLEESNAGQRARRNELKFPLANVHYDHLISRQATGKGGCSINQDRENKKSSINKMGKTMFPIKAHMIDELILNGTINR
jgi:hypothetical protein